MFSVSAITILLRKKSKSKYIKIILVTTRIDKKKGWGSHKQSLLKCNYCGVDIFSQSGNKWCYLSYRFCAGGSVSWDTRQNDAMARRLEKRSDLCHFDKVKWSRPTKTLYHAKWWLHPPASHCRLHTSQQTQELQQKFK